ncbi:MAG: hypothetical protein II969_14575 [Anaerolineaceae bacterium]|nr:hypothetical protein [Anaerolineaceae bacterium]
MKNKVLFFQVLVLMLLIFASSVTAQYYPGLNVTFGHYEQDNNLGNGTEPIVWRVLDVSNGKILLLSEYAIDAQPYNWAYAGVTWETSSLRNWLNNDFLYSAFSSSERDSIVETSVNNNANPAYGTNGGRNTQDKLFLLSISEVQGYFREGPQLQCYATQYTKAMGIKRDPSAKDARRGDLWWWWLRTPGSQMQYASTVNLDGGIVKIGYHVDDAYCGVRPAMWVRY